MNEAEAVFEKLDFRDEGIPYLRPCLELTLYWSGPAFERRAEIVKFYRQSLDFVRDGLKFFSTETMRAARPLKKDTLDLIPFWFQETASGRDIYMLFLESGTSPDEPSDSAFALN